MVMFDLLTMVNDKKLNDEELRTLNHSMEMLRAIAEEYNIIYDSKIGGILKKDDNQND